MRRRNKLEDIIIVLEEHGPLTENQIMVKAFNYDRNTSPWGNKKYADMLRRGMSKGLIFRYKIPPHMEGDFGKSKYLYDTPIVLV